MPAIACAADHLAGAQQAVAMPDCHSHEQTPDAGTARPDCCSDVAESCCLEAADVDGATSSVKILDLTVQLDAVAVLPAPSAHVSTFVRAPRAQQWLLPDSGPPPSLTLRL